jgi:putative hemolysin
MGLAWLTLSAVVVGGLLVACGGGHPSADEDERGSVGVPPTAPEYCTRLGFTMAGSQCTFPDGTSCEQWAFWRGECGQSHSYCNQHGGSVSSKAEDMGTWTAIYAVCNLNGKPCKETSFMQTSKCE